jgi:hypothetical protein
MTTKNIVMKDTDMKNGDYEDGRNAISSRKSIMLLC